MKSEDEGLRFVGLSGKRERRPRPSPSLAVFDQLKRWAIAGRFPEIVPNRGLTAHGSVDVVDLFCGCGGLSIGFETVGRLLPSFRLCDAFDIDEPAMASYAKNLPLAPQHVDLGAVVAGRKSLEKWSRSLNRRPGAPLVLIGGPPCQGFSAHRKRHKGAADERNALVAAFAEIAVALEPEFVVLENVPELLSEKYWSQFEFFRSKLMRAGYEVRAQIHNLAEFGVPQERFRALVTATKGHAPGLKGFLGRDEFLTVRDAIGELPVVSAGQQCVSDPMHVSAAHRASTIDVIRAVPHDGGNRPKDVGPECLRKVDGFRDVYGRLAWDRPSNTITAYARNPASGRYVHPTLDRGLTIREAALLQSFPSAFTFEGSFDSCFSQIGNAVPARFATFLAAHVLDVLQGKAEHSGNEHEILAPTRNSFSSGLAGRKKGTTP